MKEGCGYHVLFLILAFSIPSILFAEIAVKSFRKLNNDLTARIDAPKIDQNGQVCAIIKVVTDQKDFVWEPDGLGIMAADYKTGEYWLYIPFGAKRLTIKHPQLGILRDYLYPLPIEKATVYELMLVTGKVETIVRPMEIESQWLLINSDPPGADVFINDQGFGKTPYQNELPTGKYTWRLQKELYLPEAGSVELIAGEKNHKIDLKLKPNFGTISVTTTPETGSLVSMNGRSTGKITPCTFDTIIAGSYTLTVSRDMYETTSQKVGLTGGEIKAVSIGMNPTFAEINILTEPSSEIYINNQWKASGTWQGRIFPGVYTFEARLDSHTPATEKQTVMIGQPLNLTLRPAPRVGSLKIMSTPFEADIFLDGKSVGKSPMTLKNILLGDHTIELALTGYAPFSEKVNVVEGQSVSVNAVLVSNRPVEKPIIPDNRLAETHVKNTTNSVPQEMIPQNKKPEVIPPFKEKIKYYSLFLAGISVPIGNVTGHFMIGKADIFGNYLKFKSNFNSDDDFTSQGESSTEQFFNGRVNEGRLAATTGLLWRVSSPLLVYGGLGYGYRWVNWEKPSGGSFRVTDYSFKGLEVEAGIVLKLKRVLFSGGVSSNSFGFYEADLGLGFTF